MTLMAGVATPLLASGLACTYAVGRFMYINGYVEKGPKGRALGSMISNGALVGL